MNSGGFSLIFYMYARVFFSFVAPKIIFFGLKRDDQLKFEVEAAQ